MSIFITLGRMALVRLIVFGHTYKRIILIGKDIGTSKTINSLLYSYLILESHPIFLGLSHVCLDLY